MNKMIVQYQAHQELTNKNSLTEMNCQLQKIVSLHEQIMHNPKQTQSQEQKVNQEEL